MKKSSTITRVMNEVNAKKGFVSLNFRKKSNGQFARAQGKVYDIALNQHGQRYVVMENNLAPVRADGKRWQSVMLDNISSVKFNGKTYKA
jgi:hypothetical protein